MFILFSQAAELSLSDWKIENSHFWECPITGEYSDKWNSIWSIKIQSWNFNPNIQGERQANLCEFETSLLYKTDRAIPQRNLLGKIKTCKQTKNSHPLWLVLPKWYVGSDIGLAYIINILWLLSGLNHQRCYTLRAKNRFLTKRKLMLGSQEGRVYINHKCP